MVNKKVLILGGTTGLAGMAIDKLFRAKGYHVVSTKRTDIDFFANTAEYELESLIASVEPFSIINTVAYTQVDLAEDEPERAERLNAYVPKMLARILKKYPSHLLQISTDFVFDGSFNKPYLPMDLTNPLSVYGKTKLDGEIALLNSGLVNLTIARTAWLFGFNKKNFVKTILTVCKDKKIANVVNDQVGSPTFTEDLAYFIFLLIQNKCYGIFHTVNSGQASWFDLANMAVKLSGIDAKVNPVSSKQFVQKAHRPRYSVLDNQSLAKATGTSPRMWEDALRDYINLSS